MFPIRPNMLFPQILTVTFISSVPTMFYCGNGRFLLLAPQRRADQSFEYFNTSPGVQSSASQIAASVEKRIALTLLFLIFDKFTFDMPTFSASSFRDICRSASPFVPPRRSFSATKESICKTMSDMNLPISVSFLVIVALKRDDLAADRDILQL